MTRLSSWQRAWDEVGANLVQVMPDGVLKQLN